MMNVNHVPKKYLIVYHSLSGNTKGVVNLITNYLNIEGKAYDLLSLQSSNSFNQINIEGYTHVFIGSPTYGDGNTPNIVLEFLRFILKFNHFKLPSFSVFGTGDTQWKNYCRAVDEIKYHLSKKTQVLSELKIEQYPISEHQKNKIKEFVRMSIGR